jgi:SAM-dependent methyltransferase
VSAPHADGPASRWRSYRDVDAAGDPAALGGYMDDLAAIPAVAAEKRRSLALLHLHPGDRCLDLGCGTGPDLPALAALVQPGGHVVGADRSEALTAVARSRHAPGTGSVELVVADAHRLPFPDGAFDACRADRTLQHVADPAAALAEVARVTRPGGWVVVTEFRWGLVAPALDRTVTEAVLQAMAGPAERGEWLGHRLLEMFAAAGLTDTRAVTHDYRLDGHGQVAALMNLAWSLPQAIAAGAVTAERAEAWEESLRTAAARGEAFAGLVIQHAVGVRA